MLEREHRILEPVGRLARQREPRVRAELDRDLRGTHRILRSAALIRELGLEHSAVAQDDSGAAWQRLGKGGKFYDLVANLARELQNTLVADGLLPVRTQVDVPVDEHTSHAERQAELGVVRGARA